MIQFMSLVKKIKKIILKILNNISKNTENKIIGIISFRHFSMEFTIALVSSSK